MSDNTSSTHKLRALLHSSSGVSTLDLYTLARLALEDEGEQAIKGNQEVNKIDEGSTAHQRGTSSALDHEGAGRADVLSFEGSHRDGSDLRLPHGDALSADAAASTTSLHPAPSNLNVASILATLPAIWNIGGTPTTSTFAHAIEALPSQYTPSWSPSPVASHSSGAASIASETKMMGDSASVVESRNDDRSHEQHRTPFNENAQLNSSFAQGASSGSNHTVDNTPSGNRELTFSDINTGHYSIISAKDSVQVSEKSSIAVSAPVSEIQAIEASSERAIFAFAPYQGRLLPNLDSHHSAMGSAFAPSTISITDAEKVNASALTGDAQVPPLTMLARVPQPVPALPARLDVPVTSEGEHQPDAAPSGGKTQPDTVSPADTLHPARLEHSKEAAPAPLIAAAPSPSGPALPTHPEAVASAPPAPSTPVHPGAISPALPPVAAAPLPPGSTLPVHPEAIALVPPASAMPLHPSAISPAPLLPASPEHPGEAALAQPVAAIPSPPGPASSTQPDAIAPAHPMPAAPTHLSEIVTPDVSHPVTQASSASPEGAPHGGSVLPAAPDVSPNPGVALPAPSTHQASLDAVVKASPAASLGESVKVEHGTDLDRAADHELPASKTAAEPANPSTGDSLMHRDVEYASHDEVAYGPTGSGIPPELAHQFMAEFAATPPQADVISQASLHHEQDTLHALAIDAVQIDGGAVNKVMLIDAHALHNDAANFDGAREIDTDSIHGISGS